uniref:Leukocyte surface antigen CD47 n=1 Tax=Sus scrofa TaxID=9823 RepID=A0A4X1SMZ3_PIG
MKQLYFSLSGSSQLIFNITKSVEFTVCNTTVTIPCFVNNMEAKNISELYVKWKFKGKDIFIFDGAHSKISPSELLHGIASLKMDKRDAVIGNYTCEVTELSREGETIIELKRRFVSWFSPNENILIVIFPILAILLFWGQFGILTLKYKSSYTKEKTIFLLVAGLMLTIIVIVGAILFIPGEYSTKNACGLGLIVIPTAILILLQYCVFMMALGMSSFTIAILILQVLGHVLSVVGLSLCVSECTPVHGPLLISGLGIIALAELLGLVYMKCVGKSQIQCHHQVQRRMKLTTR